MAKIIVTGFTPFAGRPVNGSWIAARSLQEALGSDHVVAREMPVLWGEPERYLDELFASEPEASCVIALGEGKPGSFRLETLALNRRAVKADNQGAVPSRPQSVASAPDSVRTTAPLNEIRSQLLSHGWPVLLSVDAGSYLCEETLFLLEYRFRDRVRSGLVLFVHVPPYETPLLIKGQEALCDESLLRRFMICLSDVVTAYL